MNQDATILRRYAECAAFVLLWMACGYCFRLHPLVYQFLGIPFVVLFQHFVARRPVAQLWAFDAPRFKVDWRTGAMAVGLFAICSAMLIQGRGRAGAAPDNRWFLVLIAMAALPAAFALREQRAADFRRAFGWLGLAIVVRLGWHVAWAPTYGGASTFSLSKVPDFFADWICQAVALFLVDEVVFRGLLDPHLSAASDSRMHAWSSAVFVSILWGLWHQPAYHPNAKAFLQLFTQIGPDIFAAVIWGTVLSLCARRSRTLAPSAALHAAGNAYVLTRIK